MPSHTLGGCFKFSNCYATSVKVVVSKDAQFQTVRWKTLVRNSFQALNNNVFNHCSNNSLSSLLCFGHFLMTASFRVLLANPYLNAVCLNFALVMSEQATLNFPMSFQLYKSPKLRCLFSYFLAIFVHFYTGTVVETQH